MRDLRDESERQYKSRKRDNPHRLLHTTNGSNQENNTGRAPDRRVITCEGQRAVLLVGFTRSIVVFTFTGDPESGNVVGTLITRHYEPTGRIDGDYSWIIPER